MQREPMRLSKRIKAHKQGYRTVVTSDQRTKISASRIFSFKSLQAQQQSTENANRKHEFFDNNADFACTIIAAHEIDIVGIYSR